MRVIRSEKSWGSFARGKHYHHLEENATLKAMATPDVRVTSDLVLFERGERTRVISLTAQFLVLSPRMIEEL